MTVEEIEVVLTLKDAMPGWGKSMIYAWMTTPNPHFGGMSPQTLISCGRTHKVLAFIVGAREENMREEKTPL